jgi:hypothetical protein
MAQQRDTSPSRHVRLVLVVVFCNLALGLLGLPASGFGATSTSPCVGDCSGDGTVAVNELLSMVNVALGNAQVSTCDAGDANGDGQITVAEIVTAVNNALSGCPVAPTPSPTATPPPSPQELSGTITYSGSLASVSGRSPIVISLLTFDPDVRVVDIGFVSFSGGAFMLFAPAAGNYYLLYSIDIHNYWDGSLSVGAPFEVYNNRYVVSLPGPFPADPVAVPQTGLKLDFGDAALIPGIAGKAAYTGTRSCGCVAVEAFANPDLSGTPDREYGCVEANGHYELEFLDPDDTYYLRAFVDVNDNGQFDPGEPFGTYSGNPVASNPPSTNVDFSFGDPSAPGAQGLRIYVAPGSTGNASVYGGPTPTSSSDVWSIAGFPENYGYTFLGTVGVGSSGAYEFLSPFPYFLIRVATGPLSIGGPSLRIDALQSIETSAFYTGMTCKALAFYGSNSFGMDNISGPPDGEYSELNGWTLVPVIAWSSD